MKINMAEIKEKAVGLYKKIGKKTIIIASSVLVIGIAVMLNFILWGAAKDTKKSPAVDLSNLSAVKSGENSTESGADEKTGSEDYFSQMVLSRTQARDEAIEVLNGVINSESAVAEVKNEAQAEINKIAKDVENEANIETLVKSKGFEACVAVISGDSANIIVKADGITPAQISQISEIVYEQAGIIPANLKIIEN